MEKSLRASGSQVKNDTEGAWESGDVDEERDIETDIVTQIVCVCSLLSTLESRGNSTMTLHKCQCEHNCSHFLLLTLVSFKPEFHSWCYRVWNHFHYKLYCCTTNVSHQTNYIFAHMGVQCGEDIHQH